MTGEKRIVALVLGRVEVIVGPEVNLPATEKPMTAAEFKAVTGLSLDIAVRGTGRSQASGVWLYVERAEKC